ncbi:peroxisome assembly protein 26 [Protopterus annectens]|uniref:peroxisome assembly protein 26 n=1 Tax=Protopterus annectens TaxID=7888 RepID=UPI001CFAD54B|nr:peroxisome assembly protein 26 [Protopterus annectens]
MLSRSLGSQAAFGSSVGLSIGPAPPALFLLDKAAEMLAVNRSFEAALEACERGLETIDSGNSTSDQEDAHRFSDVKASFCIIGVQALAELNRWREVLPWVLQQYDAPEKVPARIMQMCILLYSKVEEPQMIQEAVQLWLKDSKNRTLPAYGAVAELYLLHVLIPLGQFGEAELLVQDPVSFPEGQQQGALRFISQSRGEQTDSMLHQKSAHHQEMSDNSQAGRGVLSKLTTILKAVQRTMKTVQSTLCSFWISKLVLATFLVYLLVARLDSASPNSFLWISRLLHLFRQTWNAMFAPYYLARVKQ